MADKNRQDPNRNPNQKDDFGRGMSEEEKRRAREKGGEPPHSGGRKQR